MALTACVPSMITTVSSMRGVVLRDGVPVPGVKVIYHAGFETPLPKVGAAVTGADGSFALEGRSQFGLLPLFPAHCMYEWSLSFQRPGGEEHVAHHSDYGPCSAPDEITVRCELEKPEPERCVILSPERRGSRAASL